MGASRFGITGGDAEKRMKVADPAWFQDRIADRGLSLRRIAKTVGTSPSNLSRMCAGRISMSMQMAAELASILGVTFEEVVRRAGVLAPKDPSRTVAIVGIVDAAGAIKSVKGYHGGLGRRVDRPAGAPDDVTALRIEAQGAALDGWVVFYVPVTAKHIKPIGGAPLPRGVDPEAVGRWSVVQLGNKGARYLRVLHRGYERGKWSLRPLQSDGDGADLVDVDIEWAAPVQWIRA